MNPENRDESGCTQQIGCALMVVAVVLVLLIPMTCGVSAIFGISLAGIGMNLMANGGRMARGEQGCRQSCLGCALPAAIAIVIVLALFLASVL